MRKPDEAKRQLILRAAARLFATLPFHEVKLDLIASETRLGKGTIYLYFQSKEDLYVELKLDGLDSLLRDLRVKALGSRAGRSAWEEVRGIVDALLGFGRQYPHVYTLMRTGGGVFDPRLDVKRAEIAALCEQSIRRGVKAGEFTDSHPDLTAQYVLAFVRAARLYAPPSLNEETLRRHILAMLERGLRGGTPGKDPVPRAGSRRAKPRPDASRGRTAKKARRKLDD